MIRWSIFFLFLSVTSADNPLWKCDKEKEPPTITLDLDKLVGKWYIIYKGYDTDIDGRWRCEKKQVNLINDTSTVQFINPIAQNTKGFSVETWNIDKTNGNNYWINNDCDLVAAVWLLTNRTLAISRCHPACDGQESRIENEIYTSYRLADEPRLEKIRNELKSVKISMHENATFSDNKDCGIEWELWDHPKLNKFLWDFLDWAFSPYLNLEDND